MRYPIVRYVVIAPLVVMLTGCSNVDAEGPAPSIAPVGRAEVAVSTCHLLRSWVNEVVGHMNEASALAAEASSPAGVRGAFVAALDAIRPTLQAWPTSVKRTIGGSGEDVETLRADLTARGTEGMAVLDDMRERIAKWPDDDGETRNGRTQQAFIWFEGVMAEMRPDLGPYTGTPIGDALSAEGTCELTIRP